MIKFKPSTKVILVSILAIGLFLRLVNITDNPPSLYGDELTMVYDSYSLLKTGHDQTGEFLPITFSMGAGRPAGYVYFSVPFVAFFGPSALGVRMLSILSGIGIIFLIYLIARRIFSTNMGIIAAFLTSFNLWDINLSRAGFEAHFALFLSLLGIFTFLEGSRKPWFYIISAISFGLSIHTYPTYKLTLPLFLIVLFWFTRDNVSFTKLRTNKFVLASIFVGLFFIILATLQTVSGGSENRFSNINIFSQEELKQKIIQKINIERNLDNLPQSLTILFHNKALEYGFIFGENYLKNFSFDFLFLHGDGNPRHNMSLMGGFYIVQILLIFLGIISLWEKKKDFTFLFSWLLIAPVGTAIVSEPHFLRSNFMLPPLILFSAAGLIYLWQVKNKIGSLFKILLVSGFIIQFIFFVEKTYFLSPNQFSRFWAYPAKQASELAITNREDYDYILISDKIESVEFAYPVYAKIDPALVIGQNYQKTSLGGYNFKKFSNVYISSIPVVDVDNFMSNLNGRLLYIGSESEAKELGRVDTLIGLDGMEDLVLKRKL